MTVRLPHGETMMQARGSIPSGLTDVVSVSAGWFHNLTLKKDGTVFAYGQNNFGQANVPQGISNVVAVSGGGYHSLALKADGTVFAWAVDTYGQTNVPVDLQNMR